MTLLNTAISHRVDSGTIEANLGLYLPPSNDLHEGNLKGGRVGYYESTPQLI
jgi:hypothetical protein